MSNKGNEFLANTNKQPLKEHSIAIALYAHLLLKDLRFKCDIEKDVNKYLIYSALLHDIGKVSSDFQKYIKKQLSKNNNLDEIPMDAEVNRESSFEGPYHNEISWAYIANFICFQDNQTREVVRHSIYWHHSANWCDKKEELRFKDSKSVFQKIVNASELLNDISKFVESLFNSFREYYIINPIHTIKEAEENNIDTICTPSFFSHEIDKVACNAKKQLCLNLLLESDRAVSSWNLEKLQNFLSSWKDHKVFIGKVSKNKFYIKENLEESKKSKEQHELAKAMSHKKLSVCGVDPAGGKTSISLYWWYECNNKHQLMIVLPRQNQVTGLFESLKTDLKRVFENEKINMEAVFNGIRQDDNWKENSWKPKNSDDLLISDINILVFDRFLSPYYKRSQSSEFLKMLKSHLILDEYHEFKSLSKMIPSLKEILTIRSWLNSEVKTIMLSGTPEPDLLRCLNINNNDIFKREKLSPRDNHKFKIDLKEENYKEQKLRFISDCMYSFLRVESCQKIFSKFYFNKTYKDKIKMIHSYFTVSDKKKLLVEILKKHGKNQEEKANNQSVITSKLLQSSYNLSFKNAIVELSQPYMDCQTLGRVNRFEDKYDSKIYFIYNEETEKFFNKNKADFKDIHENWKNHITVFVKKHKGHAVSIRDIMQHYDAFWNDEDNIKKSLEILKEKQKKAIEELNGYTPKRLQHKKGATSSNLNSLFRGESRYLSACVINDKKEPIEQLYGENLLNESRDWFTNKLNEALNHCLKTKNKCEIANQVNDFEYNKYIRSFGFKVERPLLSSHINQEIDQCLSNNLKDEDNNSTNHCVYHEKFGLVKKDLLLNE